MAKPFKYKEFTMNVLKNILFLDFNKLNFNDLPIDYQKQLYQLTKFNINQMLNTRRFDYKMDIKETIMDQISLFLFKINPTQVNHDLIDRYKIYLQKIKYTFVLFSLNHLQSDLIPDIINYIKIFI